MRGLVACAGFLAFAALSLAPAEAGLPECTFESCDRCLPDAKQERSNLMVLGPDSVYYRVPLRIGRSPAWWDTHSIMAQVLGILASEKLGMMVEYVDCEDELSCSLGVNGCVGFADYECSQVSSGADAARSYSRGEKRFPDPLADIMVSGEAYLPDLSADNFEGTELDIDNRPGVLIGPSGFTSLDGLYTFPDVVRAAWDQQNADLTSWPSYVLPAVRDFLDSPDVLIADNVTAEVEGCSSENPLIESSMENHRSLGWVCEDSWWLNPACAMLGDRWTSECVVILEDDWGYEKGTLYKAMARSAAPVAKLMVGYDPWWELVYYKMYNVTFTWWTPDATVQNQSPVRISLPQGDDFDPAITLKIGYLPALQSDTRLRQFLTNSYINLRAMVRVMDAISDAFDAGYEVGTVKHFYQKVACEWVRDNPASWIDWLPSARSCLQGQYFDEVDQACTFCPLGSRAAKHVNGTFYCQLCTPGRFAPLQGLLQCEGCPRGMYREVSGASACASCPPGRSQPQLGQARCEDCVPGRVTANEGSSDCMGCMPGSAAGLGETFCAICAVGRYSNITAAPLCFQCLPGLVTNGRGATSPDECICSEGSYFHSRSDSGSRPAAVGTSEGCLPCPGYMQCPAGSVMELFSKGNNSVMRLRPGYMTRSGNPSVVYRCLSDAHCPGGPPAVCSTLRDAGSVACALCEANAYESGSECVQCEGMDIFPLVLAVTASVTGLCAFAWSASRDMQKHTNSKMVIVVLVSLTVQGLQTLGIFREMEITWFPPMDTIFEGLSLLSFDFKILKLGCTMTTDPVSIYAFRQITPLLCILIITATLLAKRRWNPEVDIVSGLTNAIGTVFSLFFISIMMSCSLPLVCYPHPPGSGSSMHSRPSVLCFEGRDHSLMIISGVLSFLTVPFPFLTCAVCATYWYPSYASAISDKSQRRLQQLRFLFSRYRPERYFYGIILLLRSFSLSILPAVASNLAVQVCLLSILLLGFLLAQQQLRPWRDSASNILDGGLNVSIIVLLVCGVMASDIRLELDVIKVLGTAAFSLLVCTSLGGVAFGAWRVLRVSPFYHFFICHHKADAQAQARLLKIRLIIETRKQVFIDSDDLSDLDGLFDTVKTRVGTLIVYLTRETLMRAWCAGEVAVATRSQRKVVAVHCASFLPPTEEQIQDPESYLDLTGCSLGQYGITMGLVSAGFRGLLSSTTPAVVMRSDISGSSRFEAMLSDLLRAFGTPGGKISVLLSAATPDRSTASSAVASVASDKVVISAQPCNDEASAAAGVLLSKTQQDMLEIAKQGIFIIRPDAAEEVVRSVLDEARAVVVMLSPDSLLVAQQLKVIAHAQVVHVSTGGHRAQPIPVSLPGFQFPGADYYQNLFPSVWAVAEDVAESAALPIKAFFKHIAVQFATNASDGVLDTQARQVVARIPKSRTMSYRFSLTSTASASSHHTRNANSLGSEGFDNFEDFSDGTNSI